MVKAAESFPIARSIEFDERTTMSTGIVDNVNLAIVPPDSKYGLVCEIGGTKVARIPEFAFMRDI
jgi:hypothetical protein